MSTGKVCITVDLQYFNELAPRISERNPKLYVFLDRNFDREPVVLDCHNKQVHERVRITGTHAIGQPISSSARLVVCASCQTKNDLGQWDEVEAGSTSFLLRDILDSGIETTAKLRIHSANNLEKGQIKLTAHKSDLYLERGLRFGGNLNNDSTKIGEDGKEAIAQYLTECIKLGQNLPNYIAGTTDISAPFYSGDTGMQLGDVPLPAFAYAMPEPLKTNAYFWKNCYKIVMKRNNMRRFPTKLKDQVYIASEMLVLYVQSLDYISDTVDANRREKQRVGRRFRRFLANKKSLNQVYRRQLRQAAEKFGDAGRFKSGDCEDLGLLIAQFHSAFVDFDFSKHSHLARLQTIMRCYVQFSTLDAVTAGEVSNAGETSMGAHLNCNLVPVYMLQNHCNSSTNVDVVLPVDTFTDEQVGFKQSELPVVICEGTGKLPTMARVDGAFNERAYVFSQASSLEVFKKTIPRQPNEDSPFFIGMLEGFTDYFIKRGGNVGSFWFGTQINGDLKRGIRYSDLDKGKVEQVRFLAYPAIPEVVLKEVSEAIKIRIPPAKFMLTPHGEAQHPTKNRFLDMVSNSVNKRNYNYQDYSNSKIHFYVEPSQINENVAKAMIQDFHALDRILHVDYSLQSLTDERYVYQVELCVQKK